MHFEDIRIMKGLRWCSFSDWATPAPGSICRLPTTKAPVWPSELGE